MKAYSLEVQITRQKDGRWRAEVPGMQGCFADGQRLDEVLRDIQEVASLFLQLYRDEGRALPDSVKLAGGKVEKASLLIVPEEHPSRTVGRAPKTATAV